VNCIGKIRMAGLHLEAGQARADNPIDYLVHVRKIALPLFPQFGSSRTSTTSRRSTRRRRSWTRCSARRRGRDQAVPRSRRRPAGLLALFGSTEKVVPRWARRGDTIVGMEENGAEIVRVPLREPVQVRSKLDIKLQVVRTNCP
jgi:nitrate reductase / nitrite oxidoreductase, beta subunit